MGEVGGGNLRQLPGPLWQLPGPLRLAHTLPSPLPSSLEEKPQPQCSQGLPRARSTWIPGKPKGPQNHTRFPREMLVSRTETVLWG